MPVTTKRRLLKVDVLQGINTRTANGVETIQTEYNQPVYSRQITTSEGHPWPKGRGVRDVGGNFDTLRMEYTLDSGILTPIFMSGIAPTGFKYTCLTGIFPSRQDFPVTFSKDGESDAYYLNTVAQSSEGALVNLGTSFIASTIPTNPVVDSTVALAELHREGIPAMIGASFLKEKAGFFRSLGSEYLNYQFGWAPLVSDLKSAAKAIIDSDDILKQLARDSGKDVHRRRILPEQTLDTVLRSSNIVGPGTLPSSIFSGTTQYSVSEIVKRQQWFSGCYTFYYDPATQGKVEQIATQARLLYGLQLTPEVLWNLAPWSWLVDWVLDVGPVLHNLSAFQQDGLVLRYGYVMEQNSRRVTRRNLFSYKHNWLKYPFEGSTQDSFTAIRKTRRKATPYGFGLDTSAFTNRQWSILAALGVTLAPRKLQQ